MGGSNSARAFTGESMSTEAAEEIRASNKSGLDWAGRGLVGLTRGVGAWMAGGGLEAGVWLKSGSPMSRVPRTRLRINTLPRSDGRQRESTAREESSGFLRGLPRSASLRACRTVSIRNQVLVSRLCIFVIILRFRSQHQLLS